MPAERFRSESTSALIIERGRAHGAAHLQVGWARTAALRVMSPMQHVTAGVVLCPQATVR